MSHQLTPLWSLELYALEGPLILVAWVLLLCRVTMVGDQMKANPSSGWLPEPALCGGCWLPVCRNGLQGFCLRAWSGGSWNKCGPTGGQRWVLKRVQGLGSQIKCQSADGQSCLLTWLVMSPGSPKVGIGRLIDGAKSQHSWLKDSSGSRAGVCQLVGRVKAHGISGAWPLGSEAYFRAGISVWSWVPGSLSAGSWWSCG